MHLGLGPIGAMIVRQVAERQGLRVVGGIDIDPTMVGRDLGDVAGLGRPLNVTVSADATKAIRRSKPDVVVLCTSSSLKQVTPQIEQVLKLRVPIVSTTEELAYPSKANLRYARVIHQLAKKARVAVLATGVNPGFLMDTLPIALTGVCERVDAIRIDRVQDARVRRLPFQQKIGAGLTREQFQKKVDDGSVRHVGLTESISMIADALGWKLDRITEDIQPKIATETVASEFLAVDPGYVSGIVMNGIGYRDGQPAVTLHLEAYFGAPEPRDAVEVSGVPAIKMTIAGGVHGDLATVAIVVNSIPKILEVPPGLHTMRDMPIPSYFGGGRRK
jgi:4-hydroxy-tetrahydrodipicolinate reductase